MNILKNLIKHFPISRKKSKLNPKFGNKYPHNTWQTNKIVAKPYSE